MCHSGHPSVERMSLSEKGAEKFTGMLLKLEGVSYKGQIGWNFFPPAAWEAEAVTLARYTKSQDTR